eukprot:gnl/TRDRNA2_/TRDRNA2_86430_c0_seq1.p1 gnl/TRDRNA2_/TRDRNA2_86430_c0~~gnl/TRDRNA2_/TRDRNA2_86430_c0_seq1.p1  ORF type:complete len:339 (+),score=43.54 gnl/TRDRNA2_/TRDRNA2_86430_c0_seq1:62-1018(+)
MASLRVKITGAAIVFAAYMEGKRRLFQLADRRCVRFGPLWLGEVVTRLMGVWSQMMGVSLKSEGGEGLDKIEPGRQYLIIWHPHGFFSWSPVFLLCAMAVSGHPCGREWFAAVAPALFRVPLLSEILMFGNGRSVARNSLERLLRAGNSVAIQPGGVREQLLTTHDQERAVFPAGLGFIRLALKFGVPIIPAYVFNENQMYRKVPSLDGLSNLIYRLTGFGLPFCTCRFGLPMVVPFFWLPHPTDIHVRWGAPLDVGPAVEEPSDEQVEALFARYVEALKQLFDAHAKDCLPAEIAGRGLEIVRIGGKTAVATSQKGS